MRRAPSGLLVACALPSAIPLTAEDSLFLDPADGWLDGTDVAASEGQTAFSITIGNARGR